MTARSTATGLVIGITALTAGVLFLSVGVGLVTLSQSWFPLLLLALAFACFVLGPRDRTSRVVGLLFVSLTALLSQLDPDDLYSLGEELGPVLSAVWGPLVFLFPFVFLHFSLTFPVTSAWIERNPVRQWWVYLPFGVLVVLNAFRRTEGVADLLALLAIPVGLISGITVLFLQYRYSLTDSEKNRLRVVLVGCLLGILPRTLVALGGPGFPNLMQSFAEWLLPIFPVAILLAVARQNFSEAGRRFQQSLVWSLVGAGTVVVLYGTHLILVSFIGFGDRGPSLIVSAAVAALLSFFLWRWGRNYVRRSFDLAGDHAETAVLPAADFVPIRPNPYVAGNPVRDQKMFFGRHEEFRFLQKRLESEGEGCLVVFYGEPRSGKTSILYQILGGRLGEDYLPVFLDMQGMVVGSNQELIQALSRRFVESLTPAEPRLEPAASLPESYLELTRLLEGLLASIGRRQILLLVDEYELIDQKIESRLISEEFVVYLGGLLEASARFGLVFTGSSPLGPGSRWSPLFGRATFREVSFLARVDAEDLVTRPLTGRCRIESTQLSRIWHLTHGHPFYTQLLCQTMVEIANESRTNLIGSRVVDQSLQSILENAPPQLIYQWSEYSSSEKLVLAALATQLKRPLTFLPPDRIERILETLPADFRGDLDHHRIRMIFEDLRRRAVLDRDQTRYRFKMDLFRRWIAAEKNIWTVLSEISEEKKPIA